jgi:hypothetical protein
MELYTGFDLHANNSYVGIINADGKREARKRLPNDIGQILQFLDPYKAQTVGIVVESTRPLNNAPTLSFPRRRESRRPRKYWIPVCTGMTTEAIHG